MGYTFSWFSIAWLHYFYNEIYTQFGEGNGNPLQCSCLENPRDGGAWWAAVYGVAQSRTQLKRLSSSSSSTPCTLLRGAGGLGESLYGGELIFLRRQRPTQQHPIWDTRIHHLALNRRSLFSFFPWFSLLSFIHHSCSLTPNSSLP